MTTASPNVKNKDSHIFQLYTLRLQLDALRITRDDFIQELAKKGISSRLYYPCLHYQGVFKEVCKLKNCEFPNSLEFNKSALSIPIYPGMSNDEVSYVIEAVKEIAQARSK